MSPYRALRPPLMIIMTPTNPIQPSTRSVRCGNHQPPHSRSVGTCRLPRQPSLLSCQVGPRRAPSLNECRSVPPSCGPLPRTASDSSNDSRSSLLGPAGPPGRPGVRPAQHRERGRRRSPPPTSRAEPRKLRLVSSTYRLRVGSQERCSETCQRPRSRSPPSACNARRNGTSARATASDNPGSTTPRGRPTSGAFPRPACLITARRLLVRSGGVGRIGLAGCGRRLS
jgi:hypothetical protein